MITTDYFGSLADHINDVKYQNRSRLYLLPALSLLKSNVTLYKLASFINAVGTSEQGGIYLYVNLNKPAIIKEVIDTLSLNNELEREFIINTKTHVIVVKPPINYDAFLQGEYTKIYTPAQIKKCFPDEGLIKAILKKQEIATVLGIQINVKNNFIRYVQKEFNIKGGESDISTDQYDIPPSLSQETYG